MTAERILTIEDDAAIRRGIVDALKFAGYEVLQTGRGHEGLTLATTADYDLLLLDLVLPECDGMEILSRLRAVRPTMPVIILTARGDEADRVAGLRDGADDYVVKPFSVRELLARVEAVLRRSAERPTDLAEVPIAAGRIDLARREVQFHDGRRTELSEREVEIIRYLAINSGRAVTREELLANVWRISPKGLATRTIDMHIARLREKLGDDPAGPETILTVRRQGYMWRNMVLGLRSWALEVRDPRPKTQDPRPKTQDPRPTYATFLASLDRIHALPGGRAGGHGLGQPDGRAAGPQRGGGPSTGGRRGSGPPGPVAGRLDVGPLGRPGERPPLVRLPRLPAGRSGLREPVQSPSDNNASQRLVTSPLLDQTLPLVLVHFQFEPDGRLTSPQVPERTDPHSTLPRPALDEEAVQKFRSQLSEVRTVLDRKKLLALLPASPPTPTPTPVPAVAVAQAAQADPRAESGPAGSRPGRPCQYLAPPSPCPCTSCCCPGARATLRCDDDASPPAVAATSSPDRQLGSPLPSQRQLRKSATAATASAVAAAGGHATTQPGPYGPTVRAAVSGRNGQFPLSPNQSAAKGCDEPPRRSPAERRQERRRIARAATCWPPIATRAIRSPTAKPCRRAALDSRAFRIPPSPSSPVQRPAAEMSTTADSRRPGATIPRA